MSQSFKTCGISNALNGTEDDAVYEEEMEEEFDTDSDEDEP